MPVQFSRRARHDGRECAAESSSPRRAFLKAIAALPFAPLPAQACIVLDDYAVNGLHDLSAALRDGPVKLLAQDYPCLPVRFCSHDVIQGVPGRSRLLFESPDAAFAPVDRTQPTDNWHFEDFDVQCEAPGDAGRQQAFYLPSCRRGSIKRVTISDFGGTAVLLYGQRIAFSGPGAPSIDQPCGFVGEEWQCGGVRAPSDATLCVFEDLLVRRCWMGFQLSGTPAPSGVARVKGATANMNSFIRPVVYNCRSDAFMVWQGATNYFQKPIAGQNGRNGITAAWYGNVFEGAVLERNAGWGVMKTGHAEQHDNEFPRLHNGGSNGLGLSNVPL